MILEQQDPSKPVLFDITMMELKSALKAKLSWLNYVYFKAHRLVHEENNKEKIFPAAYMGNGEYLSLLPSDDLGNYMFFDFDDPQVYEQTAKQTVSTKCSLIFWFNLENIYDSHDTHRQEEIKNEVYSALISPGIFSNSRLIVNKVFEKAENVFTKYSIKQIDSQFLSFPYSGLRFECEISTSNIC